MAGPRTTVIMSPELVAAIVEDAADTMAAAAAENGTGRVQQAQVTMLRRDARTIRNLAPVDGE